MKYLRTELKISTPPRASLKFYFDKLVEITSAVKTELTDALKFLNSLIPLQINVTVQAVVLKTTKGKQHLKKSNSNNPNT